MKAAAITLLGLLGLVAAATSRWHQPPAAEPGELRVVFGYELSSIDPRLSHPPAAIARRLADAIWDELIVLDEPSLEAQPRVAERWAVEEGGRRLVFFLQPGARWSNGEPVTAGDFVRTVHWFLEAPGSFPLLDALAGIGALRPAGEANDRLRVRARDERTLELELTVSPAEALAQLAAAQWIPIHETTPRAFAAGGDWRRRGALVSNGPYTVGEFDRHGFVLDRNPHHSAGAEPGFSRIRGVRTEGPSLFGVLFAADQADLSDGINVLTPSLGKMPENAMLAAENTASVSSLHFNLSRPPLNDPRVRRALSLALDRAAIARQFRSGDTLPAWSFTPSADAATMRVVAEDLPEARRLLAAAGFPDGKGFPVLRIPIVDDFGANPLPYYCAEQWRKRLGVRVYVSPLPPEEVGARVARGDFDVIHYRWTVSPRIPTAAALQWRTPLPAGFQPPANPVIEERFEAARRSGPERRDRWTAFEHAFVAEALSTPVVVYRRYTLVGDRVDGWVTDIFGRHPIRELRPKKEDRS